MEQTIELRIVDPKTLKLRRQARTHGKSPPIACPTRPLRPTPMRSDSFSLRSSRRRRGPSPSSRAAAASAPPSPTSSRKWRFSSNRPIRSTICAPSLKTSCARPCRPSISGEPLKISPPKTGRGGVATAFAMPLRQVRKLRLLGNILPGCSNTSAAATCPRSDTSARSLRASVRTSRRVGKAEAEEGPTSHGTPSPIPS